MQAKRRRLPHFESLSAALFATLAVAAAQPARAQPSPAPMTSSTPSSTGTTATTPGSSTRSGTLTSQAGPDAPAIAPNRWTADQIAEAFKRTDANRDGMISRQEAAIWAGLARRFDQVDANRDGSLSSAEFTDALK